MSSFAIKSVGRVLNAMSYISAKYASKKALSLFTTPRKGRYTEAQNQLINTAQYEVLRYHSLYIATYRWPGKGKTILLAHGWESNTSRWDYIRKALSAQDYNVIALDAPSHGKSTGHSFNALLYSEFINVVAQKYNPDTIIGHSVGGMATVFFMHNHQLTSVKKLILLGAPAHLLGVFSRYKAMMGYNNRISTGLDRIVLKNFGQPVDYYSAAAFTASIKAKGLIIHDKQDKIIPYEDALLFAKHYYNSELITTSGFGHGLKAPSLTPKLIDFINR